MIHSLIYLSRKHSDLCQSVAIQVKVRYVCFFNSEADGSVQNIVFMNPEGKPHKGQKQVLRLLTDKEQGSLISSQGQVQFGPLCLPEISRRSPEPLQMPTQTHTH